jgi:AcrR family transcriptional regulator
MRHLVLKRRTCQDVIMTVDVGAPVDARVRRTQELALSSARELMVEEGWAALTHARVAERSGVGRATLYRHWPTTSDLATATVASFPEFRQSTPTGDLRHDLAVELKSLRTVLRSGPLRPLFVSLINMATFRPEFVAIRNALHEERTTVIRGVLGGAIKRGELPPRTEVTELIAALAGPIFYDALVVGGTTTDHRIERSIDAVLDAARSGRYVPVSRP